MTASLIHGPLIIRGLNPPMAGPTPYVGGGAASGIPDNPDWGPSLGWAGWGLKDPRYQSRVGMGANVAGGYPNQDCGWYGVNPVIAIDQAPATASTTNIAAAANVANGVAMALAGASTGITVLGTGGLTILPTGLVVPAGALVLDGNPSWAGAGSNGALAFFDPTVGLARAVTITGAAGSAGGNFLISGNDVYGTPMTQLLTVGAASAATTTKAFKFIRSVVPQFTDAHNYSVGTADVFGFPLRVDRFAYADIFWNDTAITSSAGFVAAVTTSPATNLTGDTRGTYALQGSSSDGTKKLQVFLNLSVANLVSPSTYAALLTGLVGVPNA